MLTISQTKRGVYAPADGILAPSTANRQQKVYMSAAHEYGLPKKLRSNPFVYSNFPQHRINPNAKLDMMDRIALKGGSPLMGATGFCLMISSLLFNAKLYWPADAFLISAVSIFIVTLLLYKKS